MRQDEIRDHSRDERFRGLRSHLSKGTSCDVRHPELMSEGRTEGVILVALGEGGLSERSAYLDPSYIT